MFFIPTVEVPPSPCCSQSLRPEQTQPGSSARPAALTKFPPFGMHFSPAAGKAHTVVPPGQSCYRTPPCAPRRDSCPAEEGQGSSQHSHSTEQGAELGAQGLHTTILSPSANTQQQPSCSPGKKESLLAPTAHIWALLTSGSSTGEFSSPQPSTGFTISASCPSCLIALPPCRETSKFPLKCLNGETNLAFVN